MPMMEGGFSGACVTTTRRTGPVGILTSLDAVRQADRLVDAMRLADDLAFEASRDGGARTIRVLSSVFAR